MKLLDFVASGGVNTAPGFGFKATIVLCDFNPGTRNITLQPGTYRIATVGGGGGQDATPGNAVGGTSSWNAGHQATGGAARAAGGIGSGGDVNTSGATTSGVALGLGGGASGHRLGSAPGPNISGAGGGWSSIGNNEIGGMAIVDGFGLGIPPAAPMSPVISVPTGNEQPALYGCGASIESTRGTPAGPGGGGGVASTALVHQGGPGGGGAGGIAANFYPGSGGGYSEKVVVVAAAASFPYTVGVGGAGSGSVTGGTGCVIVEKIG